MLEISQFTKMTSVCVQKESNIRLHMLIFTWVGVETISYFVVEIAAWSPKM